MMLPAISKIKYCRRRKWVNVLREKIILVTYMLRFVLNLLW